MAWWFGQLRYCETAGDEDHTPEWRSKDHTPDVAALLVSSRFAVAQLSKPPSHEGLDERLQLTAIPNCLGYVI